MESAAEEQPVNGFLLCRILDGPRSTRGRIPTMNISLRLPSQLGKWSYAGYSGTLDTQLSRHYQIAVYGCRCSMVLDDLAGSGNRRLDADVGTR
jgi:hypothetical protein